MGQTYEAILRGDHLEWKGESPPTSSEALPVRVTVLQPAGADATPNADTRTLVELFEELARRGTVAAAIPDPVAWQREMREDRPLPGRE